jgi:hypothetical protein
MMPLRNWNDDDEFLLDVSDAMRPDPAEQRVIAAARAVYAWRGSDADRELAALLYDSCLDRTATVRAPISGGPRNLVFGLGTLRIEIELSDAGIEGQLIPPEPGVVRLLTVAGLAAETIADEVGCFTFATPPKGPIRIECVVNGRPLATAWINA